MMKLAAGVCFVVLMMASSAQGQSRGFGAGIILGEPTGFSFKGWTSSANAIDAGISWSFRRSGFFRVHADYVWHFMNVFPREDRLVLYAGPGARLGFSRHESVLGLRIVGGMAYWIPGAPLEVFLEFAPVMDLAPSTEATAEGGIGIRFFFP
ncbi:MAG: hypothetical protein AB1428_12755 [Bacteroidota bacterium]